MATIIEERNKSIKELLNGTCSALKMVVPIKHNISKPVLIKEFIQLHFGVFIGITGDIKGKLVLEANKNTFGSIGELMFGMPIDKEMLVSFSGELGNMLAGNLSTSIIDNGVDIDITSPTIMQGETKISGYNIAIKVTAAFSDVGDMDIYLLLD